MDDDPDPPAPRRGRPQSNGADVLDRYRTEIEEMRRCNVPLKDIMDAMSARHNCTASINSYKRKFSKWGSHRYKRKERRSANIPSTRQLSVSQTESQPQSTSATPETTPASSEENHAGILTSEIETLDREFRQLDISVQSEKSVRRPPTPQHVNPIIINGFADTKGSPIESQDSSALLTGLQRAREARCSDDTQALQEALVSIRAALHAGAFEGLEEVLKYAIQEHSCYDCPIPWHTRRRGERNFEFVLHFLPHLIPAQKQYLVRHVDEDTLLECIRSMLSCEEAFPRSGLHSTIRPVLNRDVVHQRADFEPFSSLLFTSSATFWSATAECLDDMAPNFRNRFIVSFERDAEIPYYAQNPVNRFLRIRFRESDGGPDLEKPTKKQQLELGSVHGLGHSLSSSEELQFLVRPNEERQLAWLHNRFKKEFSAIAPFLSSPLIIDIWKFSKDFALPGFAFGLPKVGYMEAWDFAMASLHRLAKGFFWMSAEEASILVCLARSVQACVPATQAKGSSQLFVSDLENWTAMIKPYYEFGKQLQGSNWFYKLLKEAWNLNLSGYAVSIESFTVRQTVVQMIIAARHLIRWALQILDTQEERGQTCRPELPDQGMQEQAHTKKATAGAEKVPPGKDPPTLQAGIAAFINRAVETSAALGFVIGLILCLVSVFAFIVASTPSTPVVAAPQEFEESCSACAGSVTMSDPTLTSRAATPEFDVWLPQTSPAVLPG